MEYQYNPYVEELQKGLNERGANLDVDGKYGEKTSKENLAKLIPIETAPEQEYRFGRYIGASGANVRESREGGTVVDYIGRGETFVVFDEELDKHKRLHVAHDGVEGYLYTNYGKYVEWVDEAPKKEPTIDERIRGLLDIALRIATPDEYGDHAEYLYGGQGHKLTVALVERCKKSKPEYLSNGRDERLIAKAHRCEEKGEWRYPQDYAWDCSGLWWYSANKAGIYGKRLDATAATTYSRYCTPIKKSELRPGDLVFYENSAGKITHMGIVGYDGKVYEAMSGYVGLVIGDSVDDRSAPYHEGLTKSGTYKRRAWTHFGRPKIFAK